MCGIAGFFSESGFFKSKDLEYANRVMAHRGPDAHGIAEHLPCALAHRRLSILDLREAANQPMYSACGKAVIAFNGEVYNFREIAEDLNKAKPGLTFRTSSDTEILAEAYLVWGPAMLEKMNGMFAIAIYNIEKEELFITRDRMGIKPVYYRLEGNNLLFASELKACITPDSRSSAQLNAGAVSDFFHLGFVSGEKSIFSEVKKFPAGHYAIMNKKGFQLYSYWSAAEQINQEIIRDENEALEKFLQLAESSVRYRMISDVPFGTFLSGGIDSSFITAMAQKISDKPVRTFSIGFREARHNESKYAEAVSKALGTEHHTFTVTAKDALEILPLLQNIYDEPYADSSALPTLLVSKLARQHVTMTLSGDGGDELFMGYGAYNWARRLHSPFFRLSGKFIRSILRNGDSRKQRAAELFGHSDIHKLHNHIFSQEQYLFSEEELIPLLKNPADWEDPMPALLKKSKRNLSPAEKQALFDLEYYLRDDLLVKVDRASMHYSLETRVPMLDYRIVRFALNLDENLKYRDGEMKYLLKRALYTLLPESLFNRPKQGFSIPLGQWLRAELKEWCMTYVSAEAAKKFGVLNAETVHRLQKDFFENGKEHLYNKIWLVLVFHRFMENCSSVSKR
jgi:asparagine synthase (glutamine-hydrolysing)